MEAPEELAKKIVELRIALRRLCMCEDGDKALLSLKTKALFVISTADAVSPATLMRELRIVKPNLTVLAKELEHEGLIVRTHTLMDRRAILYRITPQGRAYLETRVARIADLLAPSLRSAVTSERLNATLDELLSILSENGI